MIIGMRTEDTTSPPWKKNLRAIWFAELVAIVGFTVVIPILPLYVRELGVTGESEIRLWSGVIFSAQAVTMAIFGPIWGALSDRYGRKVMVERAMLTGAFIITLMGLVQTPEQLVLLRALQGALTGTVTAATALVATSAPEDKTGYALGTLQMAVYVGASAGPLLGGLVADTLGYRSAFFITGALLLIATIFVLVLVEEPRRGDRQTRDCGLDPAAGLGQRLARQVAPILSSPPLLAILTMHVILRLAARLSQPTLPLFVESLAPTEARIATLTGLISGANALGGALGGHQLGALGDRLGYRTIMVTCALGSVLCYVPQSLVARSWWLIPLQAVAGLAMGGILAAVSASLAALAPRGKEGIVYGIDASVVSVANVIGPMTGSSLAAWLGLRAPFLAAAVVFGVGAAAGRRLLPKPAHEILDQAKTEGIISP